MEPNQLQSSFTSARFHGTLGHHLLDEFLFRHCTALILVKLLHDADGFLVANKVAARLNEPAQLSHRELASAVAVT